MSDDDLRSATDEELQHKVLTYAVNSELWQAAKLEIDRRHHDRNRAKLQEMEDRLAKTHWTVSPGFWVAVLAMIFAAIAAWPVIREWFQPAPPANTNPSSPSTRPVISP